MHVLLGFHSGRVRATCIDLGQVLMLSVTGYPGCSGLGSSLLLLFPPHVNDTYLLILARRTTSAAHSWVREILVSPCAACRLVLLAFSCFDDLVIVRIDSTESIHRGGIHGLSLSGAHDTTSLLQSIDLLLDLALLSTSLG